MSSFAATERPGSGYVKPERYGEHKPGPQEHVIKVTWHFLATILPYHPPPPPPPSPKVLSERRPRLVELRPHENVCATILKGQVKRTVAISQFELWFGRKLANA